MTNMRHNMAIESSNNGSMTCKHLFNHQSNLLNSSMRKADNHRLLRQEDNAFSHEDLQDNDSIDSPMMRSSAKQFLERSGCGSPDGMGYDSGED